MNARSQTFELSVEGRQIEEAVATPSIASKLKCLGKKKIEEYRIVSSFGKINCVYGLESLFHTLLFHRTLGKFHYKQEGSYSIGTVGIVDVDCDFVDFTYVRVASNELDQALKKEIAAFSNTLRSHDGPGSGQISLEFYQKKRGRWPFPAECIPWEVWTVKIHVISLANEHERQRYREQVGDLLAEKVMYIAQAMNRHEYVPKMPNQSELELVFDTSCPDVQPYLFKISHQTTGPSSASVSTTMRRLIKDTLAL